MSKKVKRILSLVMAMAMLLALAACGDKTPAQTPAPTAAPTAAATATPAPTAAPTAEPTAAPETTMVVGYSPFSEKFSPFFAKTAYDQDAAAMTQVGLIGNDRGGSLVLLGIEGETRDYNGVDYFYSGIADTVVTQNADGTVDYDITIRDDIVFSDGEPMSIDDVIFNMYVLSDPSYVGSSTFYALPIEGMAEYRSGMDLLSNLILAAGIENTDFSLWTEQEQTDYWTAFWVAGEAFAEEIFEYCKPYGATTVAEAAGLWGFGDLPEEATAADFFQVIVDTYGFDISDSGINYESAGSAISDLILEKLGDKADVYTKAVSIGNSASSITGIQRTGDYSVRVHMTEFSATAIYQLGISVAPLHYYGDASLYNYAGNSFGFPKGDLSIVRSKTTQPMGAGAYVFQSYQNGTITYKANELYYKGAPKTTYVLFQEGADGDKLAGIVSGQFDVTDPSFSTPTVEAIKGYNSNGELTGNIISTSTVNNLGYGYIGISAVTVNVGGDIASDASKALRKGFATLFSVHRDTVINSYYGDRASVIQYPISNTSWAAPPSGR